MPVADILNANLPLVKNLNKKKEPITWLFY
jgi:hypothetical protein